MPGPIYHPGVTTTCPHGGQAKTIPATPRALASGLPVATMADQTLVAGCAFNVAGAPSPCVRVNWLTPSLRVRVMNQPVLLQASGTLCVNPAQAPQGPAVIAPTPTRVIAT